MILYLTYWFPAEERARSIASFMTATAIAGVIGGPLSGALLSIQSFGGLDGWQWLFLLEGLPAILLGFVVLGYLPDGPHEAAWLAPAERAWVTSRLALERHMKESRERYTLRQALLNGRIWLLAAVYFCLIVGLRRQFLAATNRRMSLGFRQLHGGRDIGSALRRGRHRNGHRGRALGSNG